MLILLTCRGPWPLSVRWNAGLIAFPTIERTLGRMALEEQADGLRSQEEMIEELATDMMREMPRKFWN